MKKLIILFFALSFFFISCGKKAEEGTHVHDDGSVHDDHATDTTKQEEFKVVSDSTASDSTEHAHQHEKGEEHKH
ncbi:MAG: hypothetical protein IPK96_08835 [Flammeovirgaceae bacterium]|nr:hypothetical protein [Flammeovirgaceae bacterium]